MDPVLVEAVARLSELSPEAQRQIGVALLGRDVDAELPVIQFADPALDRRDAASDTISA